jgi:diacylglycerol kinase (ATP)
MGPAVYRLYRAAINTWNGLRFATASEQAIREELVLLVLSIPVSFLVGVTTERKLQLVLVILLLLLTELLNTAIEKLADRLTMEHDPQIGRVKDMGSAAVAVAAVIAGLVWLFALVERLA